VEAWRPTVEGLASIVNEVAAHVAPRRERMQHIGLFGYSRGVGRVKLPRAIGFTAALYSIGVPPELIATGRGLRAVRDKGGLEWLAKYYPTLASDMLRAGKYLNRENLGLLASREPSASVILEDVDAIEDLLSIELGPRTTEDFIHRNLTSTVFRRLHSESSRELVARDIVEAGTIRRSLG
jgi:phosphoenolpyruvate carboxylase